MSKFASRVLLSAEDEVRCLAEVAEKLLVMKKSLDTAGDTDAIAELRKSIRPAFQLLWETMDVPGAITRRMDELVAANMAKHPTKLVTRSEITR